MKNIPSGPEKIKARETVFRLLKLRPRSEHEIRQKLEKKEFSHDIIDETIQYLKHIQLIDDRRFAKAWIHSRLARPFGLNRIRFELKTKGINNQIIQEELSGAKETFAEDEAVLALAQRRFQKYKRVEKLKAKRRTFEFLVRRGFSSDAISKALRQL